DDDRLEGAVLRRRENDVGEQRDEADRKQHAVERRQECVEQLLVPGRRLLMRDFVSAILLLPFRDLFFAQTGSRGLEPLERILRRAFAQLRHRRRNNVLASPAVTVVQSGLGYYFMHGG